GCPSGSSSIRWPTAPEPRPSGRHRMARFIWFWTFWHWSTESFRSGALSRGPLIGVGGHWDEWYRHEATVDEQQQIVEVGLDPVAQRQFVVWLARRWAR